MTQKAINYGIVLYQLGISQDMVEEIKALVDENLELADALASPVVEHAEKRKVIDRVFDRFGSKELVNFMKTLCDNDGFDMINDIFDEYEKYAKSSRISFRQLSIMSHRQLISRKQVSRTSL